MPGPGKQQFDVVGLAFQCPINDLENLDGLL